MINISNICKVNKIVSLSILDSSRSSHLCHRVKTLIFTQDKSIKLNYNYIFTFVKYQVKTKFFHLSINVASSPLLQTPVTSASSGTQRSVCCNTHNNNVINSHLDLKHFFSDTYVFRTKFGFKLYFYDSVYPQQNTRTSFFFVQSEK